MSLNNTPSSERIHIGIFGKRNAGKSSLINALTGQSLAIVSDIRGTTTDPVSKAMELLPLGPVVMIDTPGIDDDGPLGRMRVQKSYQVLNKTDLAVLVVEAALGLTKEDEALLRRIRDKQIPFVVVFNKEDQLNDAAAARIREITDKFSNYIAVSSVHHEHIWELKELIAAQISEPEHPLRIVGDLLSPADLVILVVPIDKAAPKGRLILPQQQTIRDILDADAAAIVVKENRLQAAMESLGTRPKLVITDSQVFRKVADIVPREIPLTSFSILFARYKGELEVFTEGVKSVKKIKDGDRILVSEGCTHHRQCEDIGTVKIPDWIRKYTGKNPEFVFTSGVEFPEDLTPYRLIIHCGGCTLNRREMKYRIACARDAGIPITNYGILISFLNGILDRCIEIFNP